MKSFPALTLGALLLGAACAPVRAHETVVPALRDSSARPPAAAPGARPVASFELAPAAPAGEARTWPPRRRRCGPDPRS